MLRATCMSTCRPPHASIDLLPVVNRYTHEPIATKNGTTPNNDDITVYIYDHNTFPDRSSIVIMAYVAQTSLKDLHESCTSNNGVTTGEPQRLGRLSPSALIL